jgi:hypothetical protein
MNLKDRSLFCFFDAFFEYVFCLFLRSLEYVGRRFDFVALFPILLFCPSTQQK